MSEAIQDQAVQTSKVIVDIWTVHGNDAGVHASRIVDGRFGCEGIDISKYEIQSGSNLRLTPGNGHIFSLLKGAGTLRFSSAIPPLTICSGTHAYVPPSYEASFQSSEFSVAIHASAPGDRPHGEKLLIHNERYMAPSRFVLTPQYLSRRAFLNRDRTLRSKNGDAVAWFHTTMFDTQGLPPNVDGRPVFKMSYDHQSEVNVIYETSGEAGVRFAEHPYGDPVEQKWSDWYDLDAQTTYYLNEGSDGEEIERFIDEANGLEKCLRNRHEIYIAPGGYVSLCCLFDPGPTGLETHQPGEYSSYAPVAEILGRRDYQAFVASVSNADRLIHNLSLEEALNGAGVGGKASGWLEYESLLLQAVNAEKELIDRADPARREIMQMWRMERQFPVELG